MADPDPTAAHELRGREADRAIDTQYIQSSEWYSHSFKRKTKFYKKPKKTMTSTNTFVYNFGCQHCRDKLTNRGSPTMFQVLKQQMQKSNRITSELYIKS